MTHVLTAETIYAMVHGADGYLELSKRGDARGVAALYTASASYVEDGEVIALCRNQIFDMLKAEYAEPDREPLRVDTHTPIVAASGKVAHVTERFENAKQSGWVHMTVVLDDGQPRISYESVLFE